MSPISDLNSLLGHRNQPQTLSYGTAGFRGPATTLFEAVLRCGVLAAARSHVHSGRAVGVMVTASHNPPEDNGLKMIEPDGSMLAMEWEYLATQFVNEKNDPASVLNSVVDVDQIAWQRKAVVFVGRDTRESSPALVDLVVQGVEVLGGHVVDLGVVTTPQLHFCVRAKDLEAGCAVEDYFTTLKRSFGRLIAGKNSVTGIVVDCANGVGASALDGIESLLQGSKIVNRPGEGPLNQRCGADYVQKKRFMPHLYTSGLHVDDDALWASLDGDADRLVMYRRGGENVQLADGDRFATLVTKFVSKHVERSGITALSVAVAQTAYSNGAATEYLQRLPGVEVVIAKTGVKHLEKAVKLFDIGIYWEPNGHGTVLFSDKALAELDACKSRLASDESLSAENASLDALTAVSRLANQAVGDGVADLLLIIGILSVEDMTFNEWLQLYDERCSSNMVVSVKDKNVIETEDCDRMVRKPGSLKDAVMSASSGEGCRAFVRPSGTEDVVRVYAEAPVGCGGKAAEMAIEISRAVYDFCGGVGERA